MEERTHESKSLSNKTLKDALRFWATGVTVVSARHGGEVHGMTVNSFSSLSLDPPLVSVALEKGTRTHGLVDAGGVYGVTILSGEQQAISDRFAGRATEDSDRFAGLPTHTLETGCPFLDGGLAFLDCRVTAAHDAGTHIVFIAEIVALEVNPAAEEMIPLIYFNRGYWGMGKSI